MRNEVFSQPGQSYSGGECIRFLNQTNILLSKTCPVEVETQIDSPEGAVCGEGQSRMIETNEIPKVVLTEQDQRAYIAISAKANVDLITVKRTLKRALKRKGYSDNYIGRLYNEFRRSSRLSTDVKEVVGRKLLLMKIINKYEMNL